MGMDAPTNLERITIYRTRVFIRAKIFVIVFFVWCDDLEEWDYCLLHLMCETIVSLKREASLKFKLSNIFI